MFRLLLLACISATLASSLFGEIADTQKTYWSDKALDFALEIEEDGRRDHAFYRLTYPFARVGDIESALICAAKVHSAQKRVYAFAFAARQAPQPTGMALSEKAIEEARVTAQTSDNLHAQSHVVELLLEFDHLETALSFASKLKREIHQHYAVEKVAAHLAKNGSVQRALSIIQDRLPANWRDRGHAVIAAACVEAENLKDAEIVYRKISSARFRDNPALVIAKLHLKKGEINQARGFAAQISNEHRRGELLAMIADKQFDSLNVDELEHRFASEKDRETKIKFAEKIVKRQIANGKLDAASNWIEKGVHVVESQPMDPQISKFGSFGDDSRIANVRTLHLEVAAAYHTNGDIENAIKHIKIAKQSISDLDDSSGLGKMFLQSKLSAAVQSLKLNDRISAATAPLEFLKPMAVASQCAALVSEGKVEEAIKLADEIKPAQGTGVTIDGFVTALVEHDEVDRAIQLLSRLDASDDIGYAYESFGKAMLKKDVKSLEAALPRLPSNVGRAHTCIGAAEAIAFSE